jgi:hypothetical protein
MMSLYYNYLSNQTFTYCEALVMRVTEVLCPSWGVDYGVGYAQRIGDTVAMGGTLAYGLVVPKQTARPHEC